MDLQKARKAAEEYIESHPHDDARDVIFEVAYPEWEQTSQDGLGRVGDMWADEFICDDSVRIYYLIPEKEDDETLVVWREDHRDSKLQVAVGTLSDVIKQIEKPFAEKHAAQKCVHCDTWHQKIAVECSHCGRYLDAPVGAEPLPDLETLLLDLSTCIEDGGSDRYVWQLNERVPTHEAQGNHTHLFVVLERLPEEQFARGQRFEKPECWVVSIEAVNVGMAGKAGAKSVMSSFGMDAEQWRSLPHAGKAQALREHGLHATLFEDTGYSPHQLLDAARAKIPEIQLLAGFYLDRPNNALGATGWDFMRGDIVPKRLLRGM